MSSRKISLAIVGTRGIPNHYGGFEQFAEYISVGLVSRGIEVSVYNSHDHPYQNKIWKGINIIHQFDPEYKIGTIGQFIYDLNCILDCRKKKYDIILQLGYTSSSVWNFLFPENSIIVTNMDGLEWKRTKYSKYTQKFLKYAEKLVIKKSNRLIADSLGIKKYLLEEYRADSDYIPYGAHVFSNPEQTVLAQYDLQPYQYDLLIARLEPENSIEIILDGFAKANVTRKFIVVANYKTKYGNYLTEKFKNNKSIIFLGPIYDLQVLNNLRYFSNLYFHGHTVGGTNPSLLEAMASHALIAANKNDFNAAILENDAYYFNTVEEVASLINTITKNAQEQFKIQANVSRIDSLYSWEKIIKSYYQLFLSVFNASKTNLHK